MATHDYVIANDTAANVRADLNNALAAIVSNNQSDTEPATTYANQWWYDSANNILKIRNEADTAWINFATINQTNSRIEFDTVIASDFGDGTESVPTSAVLSGTAKAWFYYDQPTPSLVNDYNVSSVTDNSTGNYTVSFTNNLASTDYTSPGTVLNTTLVVHNSSSLTTSGFTCTVRNASSTLLDLVSTCSVHGNLA